MNAIPIEDPDVLVRLARARLHAMADAPYMASALTAMLFLQVDELGTIGIDERLRVYVDPTRILGWSTAEVAGALLHEANHFLRGHHSRGPQSPHESRRWNIAGDLEINDDLALAGVMLPPGALFPSRFGLEAAHTAEWYFDSLPPEDDPECVICCGSGATGHRMPWELDSTDSGVSNARANAIRDHVAQSIRSASPGIAPGGLARWAESRKGQVNWERALGAALRSEVARGGGQSDYSWTSPNRRHRGPVILPRLRGPKSTVLCVIDTSGSMRQEDLDRAVSEVLTVTKALCVDRTYIASCDTTPTLHGDTRSVTEFELVGGGGTTLEAALDLIAQHQIDPDVVIFLTDGYTTWSANPPAELVRRRAIVVTPSGHPTGPDWADSIIIQ